MDLVLLGGESVGHAISVISFALSVMAELHALTALVSFQMVHENTS